MQVELEEAKGREITALLHSLKMMQNQIDETNTVLFKEREAAQRENEKHTVINDPEEIEILKVMIILPFILHLFSHYTILIISEIKVVQSSEAV